MLLHFAQFRESFRVAAASLRSNKLRTALTLVGIEVGVSAVIAVVTIIKGLDYTVASTFSSQGSTVFTIAKKPLIITSREDFIKFNRRKDVTHEDAEAIARLCPAYVPLWAIAVGISISTAIGLIFGLWPARKAARLARLNRSGMNERILDL
jgi:putative ABC transport system permease protein